MVELKEGLLIGGVLLGGLAVVSLFLSRLRPNINTTTQTYSQDHSISYETEENVYTQTELHSINVVTVNPDLRESDSGSRSLADEPEIVKPATYTNVQEPEDMVRKFERWGMH